MSRRLTSVRLKSARLKSARLKSLSLITGVVLAGLALTSWTQTWFVVVLAGPSAGHPPIAAAGDVSAPAVSALAIAALALVGAIAIAGPFFRVVLAVLQAVIGACIVLSAVLALSAPTTAVTSLVTAATSIAGESSLAGLIGSITATPWPWVALVAGGLMTVLGAFILVTGRRWPGSGRKYQPSRFEPARFEAAQSGNAEQNDSPITDWDALSGGSDPTSR